MSELNSEIKLKTKVEILTEAYNEQLDVLTRNQIDAAFCEIWMKNEPNDKDNQVTYKNRTAVIKRKKVLIEVIRQQLEEALEEERKEKEGKNGPSN